MTFQGEVTHGLQNGRKFGFPTANILVENNIHLDNGVYAVHVLLDNTTYGGMLYVGTRPTLNLNGISVEINIFNFNTDIYGKKIAFEIVKKIREEVKFSSTDELTKQLQKDKEEALQYVS